MSKKIVVAIDGPAGSGKSTIAKALAQKLGFVYLDTGAMYRAITYLAISKSILNEIPEIIELARNIDLKLSFENGITRVFVDGVEVTENIRTPEINSKVSDISRIPEIRQEMVRIQRSLGQKGNLVAEGRDTTTVVFPDADLKIFLTAALEERAKRRFLEYQEKGQITSLEEVKKSIENRDYIDSHREVSPLKKADDAVEIDTTFMTVGKEQELILNKIEEIKKQTEPQ